MIKLIDFEYCNFIKYSEEVNRFNKEIENGKISYGSICQFEINKRYVNFSHIIKRLEIIGNSIYGDVEFLDNDKGKLCKEIIKYGGYFIPIYYNSEIIGFDVYIDYNSEDFFEMIKINKRNEKIEKLIN